MLRQALKSPHLDQPGGSKFVRDGKHCIVGQVFSDLGVSDAELSSTSFNMVVKADELDLDPMLLSESMIKFDSIPVNPSNMVDLERLIEDPVLA